MSELMEKKEKNWERIFIWIVFPILLHAAAGCMVALVLGIGFWAGWIRAISLIVCIMFFILAAEA